jgi:hypothetical protein
VNKYGNNVYNDVEDRIWVRVNDRIPSLIRSRGYGWIWNRVNDRIIGRVEDQVYDRVLNLPWDLR